MQLHAVFTPLALLVENCINFHKSSISIEINQITGNLLNESGIKMTNLVFPKSGILQTLFCKMNFNYKLTSINQTFPQ